MKFFMHSKEYFKGYERGVRNKLDAVSLFEYINPVSVLNTSVQDMRDREIGYREGLKERDNLKCAYNSGYYRGIQGKNFSRSLTYYISPGNLLLPAGEENEAIRNGFETGQLDRDHLHFE